MKLVNYQNRLGKPYLKIAALQIWIHGREQHGTDEKESDWLIVTIHCSTQNSEVWVKNQAAINLYYDIENLITELEQLNRQLKDKVSFEFIEPYLALEFEVHPPQPKTKGEVEVRVKITPNELLEAHHYIFGLTEKEVAYFLGELKKLLIDYPRGASFEK